MEWVNTSANEPVAQLLEGSKDLEKFYGIHQKLDLWGDSENWKTQNKTAIRSIILKVDVILKNWYAINPWKQILKCEY